MTEPQNAVTDGLPTPRRYWAVVSIGLGITLAVLDGAIANVALPSIAQDLQASSAASIWIVNAYQIAIVVALLPLASLGEIVGYRRVSQAGLAVFTLASIACVFANSIETLSLARVVQGFGAAGIMSVNGALVRYTYPQRLLGRAVGINAVIVSLAAAAGPTIASAILAIGHWRWLFALNIPIGLLAVSLAGFTLPHNRLQPRKLNWLGAALNAAAFGLLITGLQSLAHGEAAVLGFGLTGAGLAAGILLIRHERSRTSPLIPLDLLARPMFSLSVATSIISFTAQMMAFVALPFFLQGTLGLTAVETGLLMTPWPLATMIAAPLAGHLSDRYSAGVLGAIGLSLFACGLMALSFLNADSTHFDIVWRMALCGAGFGFFQSPNNRAMLSEAPKNRAGAAGGTLGMARVVGQSLGAVVVAFLLSAAPINGVRHGFQIAAVTALFGAVMSGSRVRRRPAEPDKEVEAV
ncbi:MULTISPECIES: MFS transporter [unclassified Brevundimonas]|jgi:DHA2 family multidrug resistance protein-like MFS transporter|uniref:MFS transporter n=1 Tax=unclassified Brevundimonas TaxID=2622653 RepID=UPI0007BCCC92|nr:MFS transporter [Brevundimonas sp. GW460-12-10-14-LB2]ANC53182.1 multidrug MFS transporter [Brevundimonas sp. GW460-12-10-14-LB2]MEA3474352.1 MFS transporter [Pseudomonadota bacterium]